MRECRSYGLWSGLAVTLCGLLQVAEARAATFNVTPIHLFLSENQRSVLFTVRNTSADEMRFQLEIYKWSQDADGKEKLEPTHDLIFFPQMIQLPAGQQRKVRIGLSSTAMKSAAYVAPAKEGTYRILVQELPSKRFANDKQQIQVLTRMSVPIFVAPQKTIKRVEIGQARAKEGKFSFALANKGTVHTMVQKLTVQAVGSNNTPLHTQETHGWYVLSGEQRTYAFDIPKTICSQAKMMRVNVKAEDRPLSLTYSLPQLAVCSTSAAAEPRSTPPAASAPAIPSSPTSTNGSKPTRSRKK